MAEALAMTDDQWGSYTDALFALNDMCGKRVRARVADGDSEYMAAVGTLRHDEGEGLWGQYYVGDTLVDLTGLQPYDRHRVSPLAVGLYGDGLIIDVLLYPEGGVSWFSPDGDA
jgi:hypothetical protein